MYNTFLRTIRTWKRYVKWIEKGADDCFFCDGKQLWSIKKNDFPYDKVAEQHDLLYPLRHVTNYEDLTVHEQEELRKRLRQLNAEGVYDAFLENFTKARTVPTHYHIHLFKWKRQLESA